MEVVSSVISFRMSLLSSRSNDLQFSPVWEGPNPKGSNKNVACSSLTQMRMRCQPASLRGLKSGILAHASAQSVFHHIKLNFLLFVSNLSGMRVLKSYKRFYCVELVRMDDESYFLSESSKCEESYIVNRA